MSQPSLVTIKRSQVPAYLHASELFQSFDGEEDDEITLPSNGLKPNSDIIYLCDLDHLFRTVRFWILRPYVDEIIHAFVHDYGVEMDEMLDQYEDERPLQLFLRKLHRHPKYLKANLSVEHGQVDFLHYFLQRGSSIGAGLLEVAAKYGQLDCLKYLLGRLEPRQLSNCIVSWPLERMIWNGHAACINCLLSTEGVLLPEDVVASGDWKRMSAMAYAAHCNQVDCLKVLLNHARKAQKVVSHGQKQAPLPNSVQEDTWMQAMAADGQACFQYLLSTCAAQVQSDSSLLLAACRARNASAMRVLCEQGCPVPKDIVIQAVRGGSYECVRFVHDTLHFDCWVPATMAAAAGAGQLQLVQQLHEMGCAWDESAPIEARRGRQPETLRYLLEQRGVPETAEFKNLDTCSECFFIVIEFRLSIIRAQVLHNEARLRVLERYYQYE